MRALVRLGLLLLLAWCSLQAQAAQRIRLGFSEVENFPYQMGNGTALAEPPGLAVELLREAARDAGLSIDFVRMPAMRLLVSMQNGEIDGAFIFSYRDDRLQFGAYPMRDGKLDRTRRIATLNYVFYRRSDPNISWDGGKVTPGTGTVGVNFSFSIGEDLRKMGFTVDDTGRTTAQNINRLQLGRLAAYATLEDSADAFLLRNHITDIVKLTPPITSRDYYLMFGNPFIKAHADVAEHLWTRIGQIRERRSRALLDKYAE